MRRSWIRAGMAGAALMASAQAQLPGFDRYRVILERNPFGAAAGADAGAQAGEAGAAGAESFARNLRLSMIATEADRPARIGLVDTKTQRAYLITAGQISEDGFEIVEVRPELEEAVIRRGAEVVLLKISNSSAPTAASGRADMPGRSSGQGFFFHNDRPRNSPAAPTPPTVAPTPPTPQPTLNGPALDQHLREYNLQAIRQGLPPLPIQLSSEEDAKLVKEGVLPPQP